MVVVSPGRVDRNVSCCDEASGEMFEEGPRPCPHCDEEDEGMVVAAKVVLWLSMLPDDDEEEDVVLGYGAEAYDPGKG